MPAALEAAWSAASPRSPMSSRPTPQAVYRAGGLVAVHLADLREPDGQFAVAAQTVLEDLHMSGAVHGLDRVEPLVGGLGEKHVLAELLQVPGLLPQSHVHEFRSTHLLVAGRVLALAHVADERLEHGPAPGVPEHRARRLFLQMEQVEILANAPVIAPLRLLEPVQILVELLLVGPGGAVNALQHLVVRIAAPVSPRDLGELEGPELARRGHMRAAAQVDPVALPVEADFLLLRNAGDDLGLVDLTQSPEELHRLIARHDAAGDFLVRPGQLGPLSLRG